MDSLTVARGERGRLTLRRGPSTIGQAFPYRVCLHGACGGRTVAGYPDKYGDVPWECLSCGRLAEIFACYVPLVMDELPGIVVAIKALGQDALLFVPAGSIAAHWRCFRAGVLLDKRGNSATAALDVLTATRLREVRG